MTISKALQIFISKGGKIKKFKAQGIPKSAPAVNKSKVTFAVP